MKGKLQKTLLMLFVCLGFPVMDVSVQAEERKAAIRFLNQHHQLELVL